MKLSRRPGSSWRRPSVELEVITPERTVLRTETDFVILPSVEGFYGVLRGHAPMLGALRAGVVHYRQAGQKKAVAVTGGFFEVASDRTVVLADRAQLPEEIDVAAARAEREELRRLIETGSDQTEVLRARRRLEEVLAQLRAAGAS
ncbi:MAG: ATP synthase F1 subunit epsilon [Clostridia bacterium]|nr:ATP synthase F1 subunit epsilon [Clostridia bacterium]